MNDILDRTRKLMQGNKRGPVSDLIRELADEVQRLRAELCPDCGIAHCDTAADAKNADHWQWKAQQLQAEVQWLHTWDGLMSALDEHWPAWLFPTLGDDPDRDPGPRIVSLLRWVALLREALNVNIVAEVERWKAASTAAYDGNEMIQSMKWERDEAFSERDQLRDEVERQGTQLAEWRAQYDYIDAQNERLRPRQITTDDELDALPAGSVILADIHGAPAALERFDGGCWFATGCDLPRDDQSIHLPARLLHTPEGDS